MIIDLFNNNYLILNIKLLIYYTIRIFIKKIVFAFVFLYLIYDKMQLNRN
jgi:hypothetical protein